MPYTRPVRNTDPVWLQPPPPARQRSLGREEIVAAAMALADESGADAITMKAVAARLGPYTPMALYRYVYSKEGLVDLMLDAAVATVPLPEPDRTGDWRADLRRVAADTREMITRHPWYAALAHTRPPVGPSAMRRTEFMLSVLVGRGATVPDAMTYTSLIDRHVIGAGAQEAQEAAAHRSLGLRDPRSVAAAVASMHTLAAADGRLPILTRWLAAPAGADPDEQFALGLEFLLDGIAGRLPATASAGLRPI